MNDLRQAAQQALEALGHVVRQAQENLVPTIHYGPVHDVMNNLRAALVRQAEPTGKKSLQVESVVAENATTQQQIEQTPPSEYRRGYWDGFNIGKREGRIEAEDELAKQAEPVEPAAWLYTGIKQDGTEHGPHLVWKPEYMDAMSASKGAKATPLYFAPPRQAEPVEPVAHRVVAGALFDFMGWLTSRRERLVLSSTDDAVPAADAIKDFAEMRGLSLDDAKVQDWNAALAQQAEPVEPVAWSGYDLDGMVEAFSRVIESHYQRANPFQNPIDMDAQMALRILRGFIPAMKAYTAPPQRKLLTDEEIERICASLGFAQLSPVEVARAVERAHGIPKP